MDWEFSPRFFPLDISLLMEIEAEVLLLAAEVFCALEEVALAPSAEMLLALPTPPEAAVVEFRFQ